MTQTARLSNEFTRRLASARNLTTYAACKNFAETRRARKLGNNTYLVVRDDGGFGIRLHNTEVVIHYPDHIILNSGGWQTVTTKARMNEFSNVRVWSDKGVWYAKAPNSDKHPYADGINFANDGSVCGEGDDPKKTQKLRRQVNQYAKAYAKAFAAGKVPAPSGGDCWGCCMVDAKGNGGLGGSTHVLEHIKEKYYVPSILTRMNDAGTLSLAAQDYIARIWSDNHEAPPEWYADLAQEQIQKTVRKFCFRELGLSS